MDTCQLNSFFDLFASFDLMLAQAGTLQPVWLVPCLPLQHRAASTASQLWGS
jgi:hypothetical protein